MTMRVVLQRSLYVLLTIVAGALAIALTASENKAALGGQSFVEAFQQFDRTRWYISHGWSNGAYQNCMWFNRNVKLLHGQRVELSLTDEPLLDHKYTCAEIRTTEPYGYGTYEVRIRSAAAPGLVSAFFVYSPKSAETKEQDEIDMEFLGKEPHSVQLNYFVDGNGDHAQLMPLGFDTSRELNDYAFEWLPDRIRWYANGRLVREVRASDGQKLPARPGNIFISIWNGAGTDMENWLEPFKYPGKPLTFLVERVAFTEAGKPCQFEGSIVCKLVQRQPTRRASKGIGEASADTMKTLIVIITDVGFLVPSLALVKQFVEDEGSSSLADVLLITLDLPPDLSELVASMLDRSGSQLLTLKTRDLNMPSAEHYFRKHVPLTALARLAVYDYLPAIYDRILYLDGDVRIVSDISRLLTLRVPPGKVAACAESFITLEDADGSRPSWLDTYLAGLGIRRAADYLNSGVLAFERATWASVGPAALAYFRAHPDRCAHHDQSALNAVLGGDWCRISPVYNYQTFFLLAGTEGFVRPHVLHFSSMPKPWGSPYSPWPPHFAEPYREIAEMHTQLARTIAIYDRGRGLSAARIFLRRLKRAVSISPEMTAMRRNFRNYMRSEAFVLS